MAGNLFLIVAPSGAGKSTLVNALLARDASIELSISCTTRAPRPAEKPGRDYHFIDVNEFHRLVNDGGLLEWAEVHGNFYGTPREWITQHIAQGKDILLEIDWQGARQIRQRFTDAIEIFILPPSLAALEQRLKSRGQDEPNIITRRLLAAGGEIAHAAEADYVIVNADLPQALNDLMIIVHAARLRCRSQHGRHPQLFLDLGVTIDSSP